MEFFRRVRDRYLARAQAEPGRIEVIAATDPVGQVSASIERVLARRIAC